MRKTALLALAMLILISLHAQTFARTKETRDPRTEEGFFKPSQTKPPNTMNCVHNYNNLLLCISNWGFFGSEDGGQRDCETGLSAPSGEFPAGSLVEYLFQGALWIGAVVGEDTLVSVGADGWQRVNELYPCGEAGDPKCGIIKASNRPSDPAFSEDAKSDLEYYAVYSDTLVDARYTPDDWDGRIYMPIGVEVAQRTYSWSVDYAQDFILLDYSVKNIGLRKIENLYVGIYSDGDVGHKSIGGNDRASDDICGFLQTSPSALVDCPDFEDTIDLTYICDADGDPSNNAYDYRSATGMLGTRVMRAPGQDKKVSFNWYQGNGSPQLDWGPMLDATKRIFGTGGQGTPEGDRNKYYLLSNGEHDYDQIYSAYDFSDVGWLPPSPVALTIANGGDTRFLLSFGPFNVDVGDSLQITCAYVAGDLLHKDPTNNLNNMQRSYDPNTFYANLDFRDVGENAIWASWVYDNPGVDSDPTDGIDYRGEYCLSEVDTVENPGAEPDTAWYRGDGIPDFRAATAPPPPLLRYETKYEQAFLRWNGYITETAVDPFTHVRDFEGYRVYWGKVRTSSAMARLESRDFDDFKRYRWDEFKNAWATSEPPLTRDSLQQQYGLSFIPEDWLCANTVGTGFEADGKSYCFEATDWNQSIEGWLDGARILSQTGIRKTYAEEIDEGLILPILDSTIAEYWVKDIDPRTGDSVLYHKYWEYEYSIDNLQASVPHYFGVTAFDFGEFNKNFGEVKGIEAQESSPLANVVELWAINDAATVAGRGLKVEVYPNPYYGDGQYIRAGYEDREKTNFVDHSRQIHFVNLPAEATIRIYTLDGDLIKQIDHPGTHSDWDSKVYWDMRTRNNELVASGIYLFSVESSSGNQVGKFVIIF
ncbi:MAG: T9SS type A sorting domain-containing protein [Candidatus Zixiibacteriota bacterium]